MYPHSLIPCLPTHPSYICAFQHIPLLMYICVFSPGRVITPLVAPDPTSAAPEDRVTTMFDTTGKNLECAVDSWQLKY